MILFFFFLDGFNYLEYHMLKESYVLHQDTRHERVNHNINHWVAIDFDILLTRSATTLTLVRVLIDCYRVRYVLAKLCIHSRMSEVYPNKVRQSTNTLMTASCVDCDRLMCVYSQFSLISFKLQHLTRFMCSLVCVFISLSLQPSCV